MCDSSLYFYFICAMSIGSRRRDREGLAIVITWRHEKPIGDVSRHIWIPPKVARAHLIIKARGKYRYLLAKPRRNTHSRCFLLRKIETNASTFNFLLIFVYEISSNLYLIPSFRPNFYTMCNLNKIIRRANCSTYFRGGHNLLVTQSFLCWNIPISSGTRVFIRYLSKISLFHPALKRNLVFCSVYFL